MSETNALRDLTVSQAFVKAEKPRRVLVYAPLAYWTPHFETDLEIAQRHLDLGDEVELALCDGELPTCQLNAGHDPRRCTQCVSRNLQGRDQLSRKVPVTNAIRALMPEDFRALEAVPRQFRDQPALRRYRFQGFDAGMATLSSIIDFVRSAEVDVKQHAAIIHATLYTAAATFLGMRRVLAAGRYDRVYIFNGRWSMMRPAVRACEEAGIDFYTHERGADFRKFALFHRTLPHDKVAFRERVGAAWAQAAGNADARATAEAFFNGRRQRVEKSWFSFVKEQETGRLPADWERGARRLVWFTSSEFEYAAIADDALGRIYPSQAGAAGRLADLLREVSPRSHLWIRVHPNDNAPDTVRKWEAATAGVANVTLILPADKVDSYAMLEGAERVLTFGSTVGIEATFWGKTAICADYSFYEGFEAQYEARTEDELMELLTCPVLPPKARENTLPHGYYMNTWGDPFRYFDTDCITDLQYRNTFRGKALRPDYEDLRQRLFNLFCGGDAVRALALAKLCVAFNPQDGMPHSIRILSLLKLGDLPGAAVALDELSAKSSPAQLEATLRSTAKALVDALSTWSAGVTPQVFRGVAEKVARVMLRVPAFGSVGQAVMTAASAPATAKTRPAAA